MDTGIPNIGKVSFEWLNAVGIQSLADLKKVGSVKAYLMVKRKGFNPTLNLLYALEGAIRQVPWYAFSREEKAKLKQAVEGK